MIGVVVAATMQLASTPAAVNLPTPCLQAVAAEAEGLDGLARSLYRLCRDSLGEDSETWNNLAVNAALVDARFGIAPEQEQAGISTEPVVSERQAYAVAVALTYRGEFDDAHEAATALAMTAQDADIRSRAQTLAAELSLAMGRCGDPSLLSQAGISASPASYAFASWCQGNLEAAREAFEQARAANPADGLIAAAHAKLTQTGSEVSAIEGVVPRCAVAFREADPAQPLPPERVADVYRCLFRAP